MKAGTTISLAKVFPFPAGRIREDGSYTGQQFREDFLKPALQEGLVEVLLDHDAGLPVSFLEEAFGGLIREGFSEEVLRHRLHITARRRKFERYIPMIWEYIAEEQQRARSG